MVNSESEIQTGQTGIKCATAKSRTHHRLPRGKQGLAQVFGSRKTTALIVRVQHIDEAGDVWVEIGIWLERQRASGKGLESKNNKIRRSDVEH